MENVKKDKGKKIKLGRHPILVITTICVVAFSIIAGVLAYIQISRYEKGILEVCATQQDAYVQLVLDQINLKENRDDEEIIEDILETMDASSNKYWVFSKDQSMLFVKDVLETNKYKGVSAGTYYESQNAIDFMDSFTLNRVKHDTLEIDDKTYLASGVLFVYDDEDYRLCLMTEKSVLLDNNTYLEIKIQMETFVVVILLLLVLVPMLYAFMMQKLLFNLDDKENSIKELSSRLTKVNEKLMESDLHDTHNNVWRQRAIIPFIDKLIERDVYPVTFIHVKCKDDEGRIKFLERAVYVLDRNVLRFEYEQFDIVLIFVNVSEKQARQSVNVLEDKETIVESVMVIDNNTDMQDLKQKYL